MQCGNIPYLHHVVKWQDGQFLPGQERQNWTATDEDADNGVEIMDENGLNEELTNEFRRNFANFFYLRCHPLSISIYGHSYAGICLIQEHSESDLSDTWLTSERREIFELFGHQVLIQ